MMDNNLEVIKSVVTYINSNLDKKLDLEGIANTFGYSKYHLHRMFTSIVGLTLHTYMQRRRLSEAARQLVFTNISIIEIAIIAGYETQRSFTVAFKRLFKCSPQVYRNKQAYYPMQLNFNVDGQRGLRGDRIMDIRSVESDKITIVGYQKITRLGFHVIGQCWQKLHVKKHLIMNRKEITFLVGINDYTTWDHDNDAHPSYMYYAGAQVTRMENIPKGMVIKELPASKYMVFCYKSNCKDSLQPVTEYIYQQWIPQSTVQLNDKALYDFVKYGELVDHDGTSEIEYWIPIL